MQLGKLDFPEILVFEKGPATGNFHRGGFDSSDCTRLLNADFSNCMAVIHCYDLCHCCC